METFDEGLAWVWAALNDGAVRRKSPWHTMTLATVTADGIPDARTVILRGVDMEHRLLFCNGDIRAPKFAQMRDNGAVVAVLYSVPDKRQIRIRGHATVHHNDIIAAEAWAKTPEMARETYRTPYAPSTILSKNQAMVPLSFEEAYFNFAYVRIRISELEWLALSSTGHRRARYHWTPDSSVLADWLAP